jgi:hypothetical protein
MSYLLASLLLGVSGEPRYLSGLFFNFDQTSQVNVNGYVINYDFYHENNLKKKQIKKEDIDYSAQKSFEISLSVLRKINESKEDCRPYLDLNIYQITRSSLNGESFNTWKESMGIPGKEIFGLYDPTAWIKGESCLLVGDNAPITRGTLIHEFAHYWYDRWCLYGKIGMDTETFARKVEYIYVNNYLE